jgi:hypothetical protein
MNSTIDPLFDQRVADWLEADPDRAPAQVLESILAAAPTIPQVRPLPAWAGWGRPVQAMAAAVLILAVSLAGFVAFRLAGYGGPPLPTPTPSPSPTPAATQPVTPSTTLEPFTSEGYGYTVSHPANWRAHAGTTNLGAVFYPYDYSQGVDYFSATAPDVSDPGLIVAGPTVDPGTTLEGWIADIEQLQATNMGCSAPDASEQLAIDREPAVALTWLDCPEYLLWAGVVHGGRAYHVIWIDHYAVGNPTLQATDRAAFDRILASFSFAPTGPPASPGASP